MPSVEPSSTITSWRDVDRKLGGRARRRSPARASRARCRPASGSRGRAASAAPYPYRQPERTAAALSARWRPDLRYDRAVRELVIDGRRIADDTPLLRDRRDRPQPPGQRRARRRSSSAPRKEAGVDAVKLQKRDNRRLFTRALYDSPYDNENSFGATYGEHREALELDRDAYVELRDDGARARPRVLRDGVRRAERRPPRGARRARVQDRVRRSHATRRSCATSPSFGKPLVVSTGGATLEDVDRAVEPILASTRTLCLLQCTAAYPAAVEELEARRDHDAARALPRARDRALRPPGRDRDGARRLHARRARDREALHARATPRRAPTTRSR